MADKKKPAKVDEPVVEPKAPKVESVSGVPTPSGKDIDTRMADLLKEHQEMGVR